MEMKMYEAYKSLKLKIENGAANFKERNIWNIIKKKQAKNKAYYVTDKN